MFVLAFATKHKTRYHSVVRTSTDIFHFEKSKHHVVCITATVVTSSDLALGWFRSASSAVVLVMAVTG